MDSYLICFISKANDTIHTEVVEAFNMLEAIIEFRKIYSTDKIIAISILAFDVSIEDLG